VQPCRVSPRPRVVSAAKTAAACLLSAIAIGSCSNSVNRVAHGALAPRHGSLTDHEFDVAATVARAEADKESAVLTGATATISDGTVMNSNVGSACTSGKLLHIKLIGAFPHIVTTGRPTDMPGAQRWNEPVGAVLITADPDSGKACLISVQVGPQTPEPGAVLLFEH
jgi:hypothetical protein